MNLWYWTGYYLSMGLGRLFFSFRVVHRDRPLSG